MTYLCASGTSPQSPHKQEVCVQMGEPEQFSQRTAAVQPRSLKLYLGVGKEGLMAAALCIPRPP